MTMVMEPLAPWVRDLDRYVSTGGTVRGFFPLADALVTDEAVTIHMDMPGVSGEQLEIELENDVLTVRGERPCPYRSENGERASRHMERGFGRFERVLRVPRRLDPGAVEALLVDGVLRLHIPTPERLKPHRIEISEEPRTLERSTA
jgi:HSP20 family protein